MVFYGFGAVGAAIGYTLPILIVGFLGVFSVVINLKTIDYTGFKTEYFKPIIKYSLPLFLLA